MPNILIACENVNSAINLTNTISSKPNIKIYHIALNIDETIEILNNSNTIDIILLDYSMISVLKRITNKCNYNKSFIIIFRNTQYITHLNTNPLIYSCIGFSKDEIVRTVNDLVNYKIYFEKTNNLKNKIVNEINYLGYDVSYKGTQYLITAIQYIVTNPDKNLDILEKKIYPVLSNLYNNSIHNIKCNINWANNMMYCECDAEKLQKYFGFFKDTKPKIKTVIHTIINKIS